MATLCSTYRNVSVASSGVEALTVAGVPGRDTHLLLGSRRKDRRREPHGGFAGPVPPDAPLGTFGNVRRLRWQGRGTFLGSSDAQRQGSFADIDRDVILTRGDAHIVGDVALRRLLGAAGVEPDVTDRVVEEIHTGRAAVFAEVSELTPREARERLEHIATAA